MNSGTGRPNSGAHRPTSSIAVLALVALLVCGGSTAVADEYRWHVARDGQVKGQPFVFDPCAEYSRRVGHAVAHAKCVLFDHHVVGFDLR